MKEPPIMPFRHLPRDWPGQFNDIAPSYHHANLRLRERYGIDLLQEEYAQLCREIYEVGPLTRNTLPRVLATTDANRQVLKLKIRGHTVLAIWQPEEGVIVTFLPLGAFARDEHTTYQYHRKTKTRKGKWQ